jgi:hypothetical protein
MLDTASQPRNPPVLLVEAHGARRGPAERQDLKGSKHSPLATMNHYHSPRQDRVGASPGGELAHGLCLSSRSGRRLTVPVVA